MKAPISLIDQRIIQLKQRKEKLQTHSAILFIKEAQKILEDQFSVKLALSSFSELEELSDKQKEK